MLTDLVEVRRALIRGKTGFYRPQIQPNLNHSFVSLLRGYARATTHVLPLPAKSGATDWVSFGFQIMRDLNSARKEALSEFTSVRAPPSVLSRNSSLVILESVPDSTVHTPQPPVPQLFPIEYRDIHDGCLLIAHPRTSLEGEIRHTPNLFWANSVMVVTKHDESGTEAVIINKPINRVTASVCGLFIHSALILC